MATFNSAEYAWKDLFIFIDGNLITGIQNIEYSEATEHEYVYGRGSAPRNIQEGNESYEGTMTLLQSEYEALREAVVAAGYKNITKPFFTVNVTYAIGTNIQTDTVQQLKITDLTKSLSQNDKFMTIELPFMALNVKENV
jgi:hypothetical protein